jgi:hypothetical protein
LLHKRLNVDTQIGARARRETGLHPGRYFGGRKIAGFAGSDAWILARYNERAVDLDALLLAQHEAARLRGDQYESGHRNWDGKKLKQPLETPHGHESIMSQILRSQVNVNEALTI